MVCPLLKFRHPGEQWQVIPPTELSLTAGRDENGRFFLYSNKEFLDMQLTDVSITKGTGRLDERSDLTIRVRNNKSTDYTRATRNYSFDKKDTSDNEKVSLSGMNLP